MPKPEVSQEQCGAVLTHQVNSGARTSFNCQKPAKHKGPHEIAGGMDDTKRKEHNEYAWEAPDGDT